MNVEQLEPRQVLSGTPIPNDRFEDNDRPVTVRAAPVAGVNSPHLGEITGTRQFTGLTLNDTADFYRFRIVATGDVNDHIRINFRGDRGDLDLALIGGGGAAVLATSNQASTTAADVERISLEGRTPGWYFIRVTGKNGALSRAYRMTIQAPVLNPNEDAFEQNDTLAQVDARVEGQANSPNLGLIAGVRTLNLKLNDSFDIFRFRLTGAQSSSAFVRVTSTTPMDMVLFNSAGQSIRSSEAYLGQFSINLSGLGEGAYYVQVTHYALGTPGAFNYALDWAN